MIIALSPYSNVYGWLRTAGYVRLQGCFKICLQFLCLFVTFIAFELNKHVEGLHKSIPLFRLCS